MTLLIFAHRGEAQTFIKKLSLRSIDKNLYSSSDLYLFICGEGIYEAMSKLSSICSIYKITDMINYGIAGSLQENIELENIYEIRTVYHQNTHDLEFKSFTLNPHAKLDIMTTAYRVISNEQRKKISPFAHLVDREIWGIGYIANAMNIKLTSYKLISDFAGDSTKCFDLKERAQVFSQLMFEHFENNINSNKNSSNNKTDNNKELLIPFSMTQYQKNRFKKVSHSISSNILNDLIKKVSNEESNDKHKANLLIALCESQLYPIKTKIITKIEKQFQDFRNIGANISYDQNLEKEYFNLNMQINSQTNIDKLICALQKFKYDKFEGIFKGDIDV